MLFGALLMKEPEEKKTEVTEKKQEEVKSSSSETFLKTPEAKEFINKWSSVLNESGQKMYTKRGVSELVRNMFQVSGMKSDKMVLLTSGEILSMLGGMDGLKGFLAGWKAKSEGIIKGIKSLFKG
jgi:hypothetical protein